MANLIATISPELLATSISSPITNNNGSYAMLEYGGSSFISNNGSVNLITNNSGYSRMVGIVHFMAVRSSSAWSFGMFSFTTSRYGTSFTNLLQSDWGSYTCSNSQEANVDINSLQFTNNSGDSGTFYFNVMVENTVSISSPILNRIK